MRGARLGRSDSGPRPWPWSLAAATPLMIALGATGCFSDQGVVIEVDVGTTPTTSVELFLGAEACGNSTSPAEVRCDGITPPMAASSLSGAIWFRDNPARYTADVKGHTATFHLKSDKSDKAATLPIVIAVGSMTDEQGTHEIATATLHDLVVPTSNARVVTTTLTSANQVQPNQSPSETRNLTEDRVKVWAKATAPSVCVVVEHWQRGQPVQRDFVVPSEDADCDGVLDSDGSECNANVFDGSNPGGLASKPNCFAGNLAGPCLLGSLGCTDSGGSTPGTCVAQTPQHDQDPVCVPSQFCNTTCTLLDAKCLQGPITDGASTVPRIECHIPMGSGGTLCQEDSSTTINLDAFYPQSAKCGQQPLLGPLLFGALSNNSTSHTFNGAQMELGSPTSVCSFPITWKGGARTPPDTATDFGAIQFETGNRTTLVPLVLHFEAGTCATPGEFKCSPAGNITMTSDPLWACARTP